MIDLNEISEEYIKCFSDKSRIYMIEHYLKTYDATQKKEVQYKLFPRQKDLCFTLGNANNVVTTKPRQAGITTTCGAFMACECALADKESPITILVIGNTIDLAMQMVTKIRNFLLQFPAWIWGPEYIAEGKDPLKPPTKKLLFEICNTKELVLKNGCRVVARSSGPDASRGVGGVTWLIFDEMAFIENGVDVYASAVPTVSSGGHIIGISTPNGLDALYSNIVKKAKLKGTDDWNNFELVEMHWYQDPRYNRFLEWTRKNTESGDYDIFKEPLIDDQGHIPYDNKHWETMIAEGWKPRSPWYTKMCQQFNNDSKKIAQELDVSFLGSDSTVVSPEYIEMQVSLNVREPNPDLKDVLYDDLWIWKLPVVDHQYILCIDNSRGDSDDKTAFEIIDIDGINNDGTPCIEQVLEYNGKAYGDAIGDLADKYGRMYNNAYCIVESIGGYGDATILTLMRLGYPNLYYDDPNLKNYTSQNNASSLPVVMEGLPGFHSSSVRYQMLSNFANMVKTNEFKIRSKRVINELNTWVYVTGSKGMDHKDGCHDDTITCLAMGLFVMMYSMKRTLQAKSKDAAILNALISANSRLQINNNNYLFNEKMKSPQPIIVGKQSFGNNIARKYSAYMWIH